MLYQDFKTVPMVEDRPESKCRSRVKVKSTVPVM